MTVLEFRNELINRTISHRRNTCGIVYLWRCIMKLSIEEQNKFLFDRLKTEPLRKAEANKEDIKAFVQATKRGRISNYLIDTSSFLPVLHSLHGMQQILW